MVALACLSLSIDQTFAAPAHAYAPQDTTERRRDRPRRDPDAEGGLGDKQTPGDSTGEGPAEPVGAPFPTTDSIMQALMERAGYRAVVYRGDTLQFSTRDQTLYIRERAQIERGGDQYFADSVVYHGLTHYVTGFGNMRLVNAAGQEVNSDSGPLFYDTDRRIGKIKNSTTKWDVWHVQGDFTLEGTDTLWVETGHFTTCDLPEAHYRFEADKIKLILGSIVVAWPVRVYFGEVPVFWFPFMAQDIRRGRHSGLLTLQFGVTDIVRNSDRSRHISNIGYYWAISDYMDAQFSMDWWSDNWTRFDSRYRYKWVRQFLEGSAAFSYFVVPDGGREISLTWNHQQQFGERSSLRASVEYVSNKQFQQEREFNPEQLTQNIRSNIGFTRRFDWGNMSLSAQRIQPLSQQSQDLTTMTLPNLAITLTPIVLTPARSPLEKRWYNGLTWTGSTSFSHQIADALPRPDTATRWPADARTLTGSLSSGLTLGAFGWNTRANYNEVRVDSTAKEIEVGEDTTTVTVIGSNTVSGTLGWNTALNFRQRIIGTTTIVPSIDLSGSYLRNNITGLSFISAPTRVSMRATLNADIYGFFPGPGPVERIRHKFTPAINWSYSPEVKTDSAKIEILGNQFISELHTVSIGLNQTFEAKLRPRRREESTEETEMQEAPLSAAELEAAGDTEDEIEADELGVEEAQQEEARKLTILAIRTTALSYDLVEKRWATNTVSNNMTSDLLRGLSFRTVHSLFVEQGGNGAGRQVFDPFLTQLNVSFSIGERTLSTLLGRGIAGEQGIVPRTQSFEDLEEERQLMNDAESQREEANVSGERRPWSLGVDYSLVRTRPVPGQETAPPRQTVGLNFGFSPTPNWVMTARTTYDIENSDFSDLTINFRRDLHRWSANFQFLKASNGNITFNFGVHLKDLRDLKFDYKQENRGAGQ